MIDYTGQECPVCGKPFTEKDDVHDIVVCPECGAPHHRECYTAHGRCGCAEQHGTDESWDKRHATPQKPCPFCGKLIDETAVFCEHCGRPVGQVNQTPPGGPQQPNQNPYRPPGVPFGAPQNQRGYGTGGPFDPLGGVSPNEDFEGASAESVVKVVRVNTRFYLSLFSRIKNFNKSRFSFAALFLGSGWFLYRKQYKIGFLFAGIQIALSILSMVISSLVAMPIISTIYTDLGITSNTVMTNSLLESLGERIFSLPGGQIALLFIPLLISAVGLALNFFLAAKANRWYYRNCIKTAKEIEHTGGPILEKEEAYRKRGGTNMALLLALYGVQVLLSYIPMLF